MALKVMAVAGAMVLIPRNITTNLKTLALKT